MASPARRPALFLDRDGVINKDRGYVVRTEDFEWIEGAVDCIRHFNSLGWFVFVVTNQTGIAYDYYSIEDMHVLHDWMQAELARHDAFVDAIYYCPYHEDGPNPAYRLASQDRKPRPGMLQRAMRDFPVDASRSFLIGDKATDLQAAQAAGLPGFLFTGGNVAAFADWALSLISSGARAGANA